MIIFNLILFKCKWNKANAYFMTRVWGKAGYLTANHTNHTNEKIQNAFFTCRHSPTPPCVIPDSIGNPVFFNPRSFTGILVRVVRAVRG